MNKSKNIVSVFILLAFSIIAVSAYAQRQPSRNADRQIGVRLQRLERDSKRFHNSLNRELINTRIDQTHPQNDINSFLPEFEKATTQFREQLGRRRASADDVWTILQKASPINDFMARNRLGQQVQNDWASVRTDLNGLATAYGVTWQWHQPASLPITSNRSRLSDSELNQLIKRIDTGGDAFRSSLTEAFGQTQYDQTRSEGNMNDAVRGFKNATQQLRNQFDARQPVASHVERVFLRAVPIDTYMRNNSLTNRAQNDWTTVRRDLNRLADAYSISADWTSDASQVAGLNPNNRLTGTFRLDSSRSDNPGEIAQRATRNLSDNERQNVYDLILRRLESPDMLAIERRASTVTIASSLAPKATFEADGRERQERLGNGRTAQVTGTLHGEQLVVTSNGYRENDFNVTFDATQNDRSLRVRRQIYSDRLTQPVVVDSVYDRTSNVAEWNIYHGSEPVLGNTGAGRGELIVREGETVVAILDNDLSTKQTKQGDRFTMTVRQPGQYEGAVIEGTVSQVDQGGRLTGKSGISFNFDTIRLRNGQTYGFAGVLTGVRTLNSDAVKVDNEGSAEGDDQTQQTIQRTGIGTAVGAIIGAIAGGAKGAVIGAVVGAAGGAGSVYVQGKESLELPSGTELTIRASAPGR